MELPPAFLGLVLELEGRPFHIWIASSCSDYTIHESFQNVINDGLVADLSGDEQGVHLARICLRRSSGAFPGPAQNRDAATLPGAAVSQCGRCHRWNRAGFLGQ